MRATFAQRSAPQPDLSTTNGCCRRSYADASHNATAAPPSPGKRQRLTEKEEDDMYLKEQQSAGVEEVIPRMTEEMTGSFIKFGQMRTYQVEGLNWIIRCDRVRARFVDLISRGV